MQLVGDFESEVRRFFRVHHLQKAAFEEYWGIREKRVWAYEVPNSNSGLRRYFAASIQEFYAFYKHARCGRHYYEVIQEELHCRPYFDLEFNKAENPEVDGQHMMEDFLAICTEVIGRLLKMEVRREHFLILESSTNEKFSAHVTVHLPNGFLFRKNVELIPLVNAICAEMQAADRCVVQNRGVKDTFCDRGVYTRNRNFRLFHSSKVNKGVKLTLAPYCSFYGNEAPRSMQPIFLDSLVVPDGYWRRPIVDTRSFAPQPVRPLAASRWPIAGARGGSGHYAQFEHTIASGYDSLSPFPEVDKFVLRVIRKRFPLADIHSWYLIQLPNGWRQLQFKFRHFRYCSNICREHKSQNVYWIANLKGYTIVQRCFDFDCAGFVSGELHFPEEVAESVYWTIDEIFDSYLKKRTDGAL